MADPIDRAIGTTPAPQARAGVLVRTSSGHEFAINAPAAMTLQDAIELIGYIATGQLGHEIANATRPASRLVIPTLGGTMPRRRT